MVNLLILFITVISFSFAKAGGVQVGNGGNIVRCQGESDFFSLEYIMTKNMYGNSVQPVQVRTLQDSLNRISNLIAQKLPKLAPSFMEFVSQYQNSDSSKTYLWHQADITPTPSENLFLPSWCNNSFGTIDVLQVIARTITIDSKNHVQVHFDYDPDMMSELEYTSTLQLSFLVVHEWIWNLTKDPKKNRKLDYLLHSTLMDSMTANEVAQELVKFGF